ncbi:DinB family protein [Hymenobacter yonginensis]|uniref:DinB family protein n=1 Tax=Hymenobacter yonginensis TaxID=748197 RepID=A0ABY7PSV4_9BACT|nr:DinB family protein [Hymenobacter yonginensis]WBO85685.1 DinB family protein [Hymenobacter yonginensis]
MNHRLHLRFEQLERATTHLLQQAESLGSQSHQSPGQGQWSAAQVVQHLVVAETGIEQYIEKKLHNAEDLSKAGLSHMLKSALLRVMLRLPFTRFKAPARLTEQTPEHVPSLPQLQADWQAVRRRLEQTLNEYPSRSLDRAIFKHPRSGMLTIYQTLDFMLDHVLHHQHQVERIAKTLRRVPQP